MAYDLIAIGSVVKDIIVLTDRGKIFKTPKDKLAPEWLGFELGEKIRVDEVIQSLGGVAADVSIGLSRLGHKILPVSTLGNDLHSNWLKRQLKNNKIRTEGINFEKNRITPFNVLIVDKKTGERVIFSQKISGDLKLDHLYKFKAKYLYVSSLKGKIGNQTQVILKYMEKNKPQLIIAPSTSQIRDDFTDLKKLLRIAKILILNRNEAVEIAVKSKNKSTDAKNLLKLLHKLGPKVVCVTDGTKGAWVSDGKKILHSPIQKVKTVEVTGAGDAFASGFLGFYMKGKTLKESLEAGIANSASVVQYIGTTRGLLSKEELLKKI